MTMREDRKKVGKDEGREEWNGHMKRGGKGRREEGEGGRKGGRKGCGGKWRKPKIPPCDTRTDPSV